MVTVTDPESVDIFDRGKPILVISIWKEFNTVDSKNANIPALNKLMFEHITTSAKRAQYVRDFPKDG